MIFELLGILLILIAVLSICLTVCARVYEETERQKEDYE